MVVVELPFVVACNGKKEVKIRDVDASIHVPTNVEKADMAKALDGYSGFWLVKILS